MYNNIGGKIKGLAIVTFIVPAIALIVLGLYLLIGLENPWGIATIVLGPFFAWIGSLTLYGFGELVENSSRIAKQNNTLNVSPKNQNTPNKTIQSKQKNQIPQIKANQSKTQDTPNEDIQLVTEIQKSYKDMTYNEDGTPQIVCPKCGHSHDFDYPKCPSCGNKYPE